MDLPSRIVIATGNPHKVEEIGAMFAAAGLRVEAVGLGPLGLDLLEPEETGVTFEENAAIKALSYAEQTGLWCLADDSGLEVDALGGAPGVLSARYSAGEADAPLPRPERDRRNNQKLLAALEGVPEERRTARFVCAMALACGYRLITQVRGEVEGRIGIPPRVPSGDNGFGYDPLFLVAPGFECTSAELSAREKNAISHRARAVAELMDRLRESPGGAD